MLAVQKKQKKTDGQPVGPFVFISSSDKYNLIQIDYIRNLWIKFYNDHQSTKLKGEALVDSFFCSLFATAREDFLLFCVLLYSYVGQQELDVALHVEILATICQLHSNNFLYLDEEATHKDRAQKKHYKRDDTKPQLEFGDYIINIPPGHSKTTICTLLYSAWLLGIRPQLRILFATCSASGKSSRISQVHLLMDTRIYKEIFGQVLRKMCGSTQVETLKDGKRGYMRGTTTNLAKAITGDDADFLLIDDSNSATSITQSGLESVRKWYDLAAKSRKRETINKLPTFIIQQRINEKDLTGYLLKTRNKQHINHFVLKEEVFDDEKFTIHTVNCGDFVFKRPKGFLYIPTDKRRAEDRLKELASIKLDEERWSTQYQQTPFKGGSNVFRPEYFNFYYSKEDLQLDYMFITTDLSWLNGETNDYCCLCNWGVKEEYQGQNVVKKMYLLDIIWDRFPPEDNRAELIAGFCDRAAQQIFVDSFGRNVSVPMVGIYIEKISQNEQVIAVLKQYYGEKFILELARKGSKLSRAKNAVYNIYTKDKKNGTIICLPNDEIKDRILDECLLFDGDDKKHDDFCDNLTDALMYGGQLINW